MEDTLHSAPELGIFCLPLQTYLPPLPPANSQVGSANGDHPPVEIRGHQCSRPCPCWAAMGLAGWLPACLHHRHLQEAPAILSCSGNRPLPCPFSPGESNSAAPFLREGSKIFFFSEEPDSKPFMHGESRVPFARLHSTLHFKSSLAQCVNEWVWLFQHNIV